MDIAKRIGDNIRRLRGNRSQQQFSADTGISQTSVSMWESGKRLRYLNDLFRQFEDAGIDPLELLRPTPEDTRAFIANEEYGDPVERKLLKSLQRLTPRARRLIFELVDELSPPEEDAEVVALMQEVRQAEPELRSGVLAAIKLMLRQ